MQNKRVKELPKPTNAQSGFTGSYYYFANNCWHLDLFDKDVQRVANLCIYTK